MEVAAISKLIEDIGGSLIAPIVFLVLGFANSRLPWNRQSRGLRLRLTLSLALLLFVFAVCVLMFQDRVLLATLWRDQPVLYSFVYTASVVIGVFGIVRLISWKLRPKLWRVDAK
jgi:hypothetical protein